MMAVNLRGAILTLGLIAMVLTVGFYAQYSWATNLWPWPDGRMSLIFLAAVFGANAVLLLWVGLARDLSALKSVVLDALVVSIGLATTFLVVGVRDDNTKALLAGIVGVVIGLALTALHLRLRHLAFQNQQPVPPLLRYSCAFFALALILVGSALLLRVEHIFPWPLLPETSIAFGCIFLGSAVFYGSSFLRPVMSNAYPQMAAFLAYDLILLVPFAQHFDDVRPEHRSSLIAYTAVLIYSAVLMGYYLLLNPETRLWQASQPRAGGLQPPI